MAKKRKSIFDTTTSHEEIKDAALNVQKETLNPATKEMTKSEEVVDLPSKKKTEKTGKLMHLYVDHAHHRQAKVNATLRGMKLGEYIEWLIEHDKEAMKY